MNAAQRNAMPRVVDVCADNAEVLALSVLRMLAAGYSTGDVACWDMAYTGAERVLCPAQAGRFVAGMTTLIRCLRSCRAAGCSFMPATCCRVTRDEEAILNLLAAARMGDTGPLSTAACAVAEGRSACRLENAAQIAATTLDAAASELATDAARPQSVSRRVH